MDKNLSTKVLSDITVFSKYSKYLEESETRESWGQICDRYENMMKGKYPGITGDIVSHMQNVRDKKLLPSMRAMQFAGPAIARNHSRIYNCAYLPLNDYRSFSEAMFLLLGGTGVGYSVQFHHVEQLPTITKPVKERKYVVADSIEGWADAVKALMKSYYGMTTSKPRFDFGDIREKGARLVTAGGKAPGPEPLKECLFKVEQILDRKSQGEKLTTVECHDIMCHIANAVLAGGIRRAAMISLFSFDDTAMATCKYGNWWEQNEQRGRANNSSVILRHKVTKGEFMDLWKRIEASGSGEPGVYFSNDKDWGSNPCCEIALKPYQFCNLTEVNVSDVQNQEELEARIGSASFFGTLQAGFSDFHYLRDIWKRTTDKDALVGVGMTGIGSGKVLDLDLEKAAQVAKDVNSEVAALIGINEASRVTTVKPSGTTSCVLGTSSGIHAWYNDYYVRRIRLGKNESLCTYLTINHPELIEDDFFRPNDQSVVSIPQKAPEGSILRTETAVELLERVKKFNLEWVKAGHRKGNNTNNVSATISIDKQRLYDGSKLVSDSNSEKMLGGLKDEWEVVGEWMWKHRETYNGISVLPYDGGTYKQAPFEDITKEQYDNMIETLKDVDLSKVIELDDNTDFGQAPACSSGKCEI